jgi:thaumatin family protein
MNHRIATVLFAFGATACGSSSSSSHGSADGAVPGDATTPEPESDGAGSMESEAGAEASSLSSGDGASPLADAQSAADVTIPADAQFLGDAAGAPRTYTIVNQCTQTVWAAALPATTFPGGDVEMAPGVSFQVGIENGWSGRIWGKTGCTTSGTHLTCASDAFPASLAELTLTSSPTGLDFYDVSLVDGFNLPIELVAQGHVPNPAHPYDCGDPQCVPNLNATCPQPLQDVVGGAVLACANDECKVLGDNDAASPDCIYPNQYTRFFKSACPTAYSYPYDDPTSTFTCEGTTNDYAVVFCP